MIFYTVYEIKNNLNGKIYIGIHKTKDINDSYMGSGVALKSAYEKYGIENFQKRILYVYDNFNDMRNKEVELVTESFVRRTDTYNLTVGGLQGPVDDLSRLKISIANKGKKKPPRSVEHRENMSVSKKGKTWGHHSDDSKRKIKESQIGREFSESQKDNIRQAMLRKDVCCIFCKKEVSNNIYSRNHKNYCRWGEK